MLTLGALGALAEMAKVRWELQAAGVVIFKMEKKQSGEKNEDSRRLPATRQTRASNAAKSSP